MAKTENELALRALSILRVTDAGNQPDDEDFEIAKRDIDGLVDSLDRRGIYSGFDLTQIDEASFLPLATLLAMRIAPEFGAAMSEDLIMINENKLRSLNVDDDDDQPIQAFYY